MRTAGSAGPSTDRGERQGFVMLDASSRIVCANDEAIRILTYVHRDAAAPTVLPQVIPKKQAYLRGHAPVIDPQEAFEEKVRRPLQSLALASGGPPGGNSFQLKSGRRTYSCRTFTMTSTAAPARNTVQTLFVLQRAAFPAISRILCEFLLTSREQGVVALLLEGLCNKDIAQRMAISVFTVKAFLRSITMKMEVSGRSEIVAKVLARALPPTGSGNGDDEKPPLHPAAQRVESVSPVALMTALSSAKNQAGSRPP